MRAQAIEKMLRLLSDEAQKVCDAVFDADIEWCRFENLNAKAQILLDRDDSRSASVVREILNGELG